jgi:hypothetical protein
VSVFPSDYVLAQFGGKEPVRERVESAKVWLAKSVLTQISARNSGVSAPRSEHAVKALQESLQVVELS